MEVELAIRDANGRIRTQRVAWLPKRRADGPHLAGVVIHTTPEVVQWVAADAIQRILGDLQRRYAIGHFINITKGTINIVVSPSNATDADAIDFLLATLRELEAKIHTLEDGLRDLDGP